MTEMQHASFSMDELRAIKSALTRDRPYADRISLGFAVRLLVVGTELREKSVGY
jgi:hypothetical protein